MSEPESSIQSEHNLSYPPLDEACVEWTRKNLALVKIGGVWIIPSSITIVTRETETTVSILGPEGCPESVLVAYLKAAGQTIVPTPA